MDNGYKYLGILVEDGLRDQKIKKRIQDNRQDEYKKS